MSGVLWRVVPDYEGGAIGEARDPAARSVSYFRVRVSDGEMVWRDATAPGGWWTGIECVTRGALLVHGFASPDLPGHRGISALDLRNGGLLWSDEDVVFVAVVEGVVYGLRGKTGAPVLVGRDLKSGAAVSEEPADEGRLQDLAKRWGEEIPPPFALPEPVEAGTGEYRLAARLLAGSAFIEGALEMLRADGLTVLAHHERVPGGRDGRATFRRVLSVFGGEGGVAAFREVLDEDLTMPVPEAFLLVGRTLLFVRGRRALRALHLRAAKERG